MLWRGHIIYVERRRKYVLEGLDTKFSMQIFPVDKNINMIVSANILGILTRTGRIKYL